jgi:hypothetical protein
MAGRRAVRRMTRRAALVGWPLVCALAICVPLLRPGFVLGHDMVFVPDLGLRRDVLGLGTALPRAVPSDAVVAVLDNLTGGALLSKIVVLAIPALAGWGMAALVLQVRRGTIGALAAATLYIWNPYVAERLVLGHWALLLGYAALPWLARSCLRLRHDPRAWPGLVLASAACALSASSALTATLLAVGLTLPAPRRTPAAGRTPTAGRAPAAAGVAAAGGAVSRWRVVALVVGVAVAVNAPWWVAGIVGPGVATSDPEAVGAFAARDEGYGGVLPTLLTLGGAWNADVVPSSRGGIVSIVCSAVILLIAVAGMTVCWRRDRSLAVGVLAAAGVALAVALAGTVMPGLLSDLVGSVPGAGLLRDGQRYLGPLVLAEALGFGLAADLVRFRLAAAVALLLLPVAALPDLALAVDGRIGVARYPSDWAAARRAANGPGDLIPWPYEAYRAPPYTDRRPVLDPVPRYFPRPAIPPDELVVGGERLAGEDPRAAAIATAIRSGADATEALLDNGVRWIVADGGQDPRTVVRQARPVFTGPTVTVYAVTGEPARIEPGGRRTAAMIAAWSVALLTTLAGLAGRLWRRT